MADYLQPLSNPQRLLDSENYPDAAALRAEENRLVDLYEDSPHQYIHHMTNEIESTQRKRQEADEIYGPIGQAKRDQPVRCAVRYLDRPNPSGYRPTVKATVPPAAQSTMPKPDPNEPRDEGECSPSEARQRLVTPMPPLAPSSSDPLPV